MHPNIRGIKLVVLVPVYHGRCVLSVLRALF